MRASIVIAFASATACTLPAHDETGATLSVRLQHDNHTVRETDSSPVFTLGMLAEYSIAVEIDATQGTDSNFSRGYAVTDYTPLFEVPGVTIPDSTYDTDEVLHDRAFNRHDPVVIPATAKGQALHVHVEAIDERGLATNIIDFSVMLN